MYVTKFIHPTLMKGGFFFSFSFFLIITRLISLTTPKSQKQIILHLHLDDLNNLTYIHAPFLFDKEEEKIK